ncbi:complement C1q-like protein 4 [Portunus trituberculatus]|uniref:complement C1q-like protein 4 n=1 Tax=Portunus trituberculatus TaxID=210409 RepID=UPI001E1D0B5A|nr:complement C1q-like protein 4 [Portunus trituberculatus]
MKCVALVLVILLVIEVCKARPQDGDEEECYGDDCVTPPETTVATTTTTTAAPRDDALVEHHHHVKRQAPLRPEPRNEVAFTVTKGVQTRGLPGLSFETVLTNVGGAWNHRTSHFQAPYTGGYFFTYHAVSAITEDFTLALMKNGRYQVTAYGGSQGYQHASNSAFLALNSGDRVHLELQEGHIYEHPRDEAYVSFTGFMLYRHFS